MGVLVLVAAVVQVTVVTGMRILGAEPDLLLVTIVCAALVAGSLPGAIAGFAGGLVVDVMTLGTLGTTSIVLTLAGYWAGRYGETIAPLLGLPDTYDVLAVVPFGYPAVSVGKGKKRRKSLAEVAHRETFGQPFV